MKKRNVKVMMPALILVLVLVCGFALSGCGTKYTWDQNVGQDVIESIQAAEKDKVIAIDASASGKLETVTVSTENIQTGAKVEMKIDADTVGNVYDYNDVDIFGEFVSPSGKLKTMPAFYTRNWSRSMQEVTPPKLGDELISTTMLPLNGSDVKEKVVNDFRADGGLTTVSRIQIAKGEKTSVGSSLFYGGAITASVSKDTYRTETTKIQLKYQTTAVQKVKIGFARILNGNQPTDWYLQDAAIVADGKWNTLTVHAKDFVSGLDPATADPELDPDGKTPRQIERCAYICIFRADEKVGDTAVLDGEISVRDLEQVNEGMKNVVLNKLMNKEFNDFLLNDATSVGKEIMTDLGTENFALRFTPDEAGEWLYRVNLKQRGKLVSQFVSGFTAAESAAKGNVRVDKAQNRNFEFENGEPFKPVGINQDWYTPGSNLGSYEYDNLFENFSKRGLNTTRIFLTASWCFGRFRFTNCQSGDDGQMMFDFTDGMKELNQLDLVMEAAEKNGVYIDMTIFNFTELLLTNEWPLSPWNVENGGYLTHPTQWLTDKRAINDAKKIVRYLVARLGYSQNVLCWELFNEIQWMTDYNTDTSLAWHKEMATYLKSLDPDHMVTTSSAHGEEGEMVFAYMDFAAIHQYKSENLGRVMVDDAKRIHEKYNIPVYYTEMGADTGSDYSNYNMDPKGIAIHQANWAGTFGYGAGGGMSWWWDSFTSLDFYSYDVLYQPILTFIGIMDKDYTRMNSLSAADFEFDRSTKLYADAVGFKSDSKAYVYCFDNRFNHINDNEVLSPFVDATFQLANMSGGTYTIKFYDTFGGLVIKAETVIVSDGTLSVAMPSWAADIALWIEKN